MSELLDLFQGRLAHSHLADLHDAVQPVLDRYLTRLRGSLGDAGFSRDLLVMQGNGGTVSSRIVAETFAGLVDWHEVAGLVGRGCSPELALEIAR